MFDDDYNDNEIEEEGLTIIDDLHFNHYLEDETDSIEIDNEESHKDMWHDFTDINDDDIPW